MSSQPTPGPWTTHYGSEYVVPAEHSERPIGGSVYPERNRDRYAQVICEMREVKYGRGCREANAHLIAASPELYEAAKSASKHLGELSLDRIRAQAGEGLAEDIFQVTKWLTEAIAKAEGRE